jgi:hypothetical protein
MSGYADLTNLTEVLKNVYGEGLSNQFADEKTTYNMFPKSDRKPGGKGYVFGVRYARAQGTGGRAESSILPDPLTGIKARGPFRLGICMVLLGSLGRLLKQPKEIRWRLWIHCLMKSRTSISLLL